MTSDVFQAFLTYLPTLIRYFTTYAYVFSKIRWGLTYSRVPNTTVWNPYSFFGACPSYMALFGTSRLLNFKKSSFLHFYSELLAYWFFSLHHFTSKSFCIKYDLTVYWWIFDFLHWKIFIFASSQWKQAARSYEVSFLSAIWMVSSES